MNAVMEVLGGVITSHFGESRIHAEKLSIRRGLKDAQNRVLENATVLLLCVLQCLLCLLALVDVHGDSQDLNQPLVLDKEAPSLYPDPVHSAIAPAREMLMNKFRFLGCHIRYDVSQGLSILEMHSIHQDRKVRRRLGT